MNRDLLQTARQRSTAGQYSPKHLAPQKVPDLKAAQVLYPRRRSRPGRLLANLFSRNDILLVATLCMTAGPVVAASSAPADLPNGFLFGAASAVAALAAFELLFHRHRQVREGTPLAGALVLIAMLAGLGSGLTVLYGLSGRLA
ncbi:hypothetical protein [Crossiella cryophila]|uniref:Uncharacterized protein n=1 Tax=Crossiella cryophila TaxID=43355 RepID=A0A7W7CGK5_9PSEU|nr:hypothetical protein [Crossiella cryophila]MBB4679426.1 hypothetical protein [Crossiella cryophila]